VIAGGPDESVLEPRWGPDGALWFVSDRSDWWNLYRYTARHRHRDRRARRRRDRSCRTGSSRRRATACSRRIVVFARLRRGYDASPAHPRRHGDRSGHPVLAGDGRARDDERRGDRRAGSPTQEPGGAPDRSNGRDRDVRPPRTSASTPRSSPCRAPHVLHRRAGRTAHALFYPPIAPRATRAGGELAPLLVRSTSARPRRLAGVLHGRAVLDQPRVRRRRRQLRRLHGLRPRVPRGAAGAVGDRGRGRLPRRRPPPRPHRPRRRGAAHHPRRLGGRVHHARGAGPRRHPVRGGRRPLRRRRPRGARPRHAQVREPLPGPARRPVPGRARRLRRAVPDPPRRPLHPAVDRAAGQRRPDRAARAERDDRRRVARPEGPRRLPALRRRAARLPARREHPQGAGRRAVLLRPGARLRPARRGGHRAGRVENL
jgi:hypothetical protein